MVFYKDANFREIISGNPLHAHVGDQVYAKVYTTVPDWNIKLRLHTCYIKPPQTSDSSMDFFLIKDGCETDTNTHIISQSAHETTFVFQDFEYSTNREGLDILCNATFCETTDYSPKCTQRCHSNPIVMG
ncbi:CUB and zona pellucida-like domain-containing protein 1 [Mya arenaria]|uniref:CUB and zona pellucida-like domain-containing protein 1 n=1 Tax=Mya arenaria TaxID=6604 RepID=UPI0022DFD865|nr:CUB and zona pellucida-like domain-containing protein 1 [Mya arenaria]